MSVAIEIEEWWPGAPEVSVYAADVQQREWEGYQQSWGRDRASSQWLNSQSSG